MEDIMRLINEYSVYITLALIGIVFILIIVVIASIVSTSKMKNKYRRMMRGTNSKNLEELIVKSLDKIDDMYETTNKVKDICEANSTLVKSCVQKVAIKRYKAFEDVGSDLSYSIAMLDGYNNGVVITSIYSRNESITYAKPIDNGISRYDLSDEENSVLHQAINTNIK